MAGTIDISALNTPPEEKELKTAKFFSERGKNITFIPPSNIPGHRRPDFNMDGLEWEVKLPEKFCLSQVEINIKTRSRVKRILVITKTLQLIEFPPK